ncbi:MAG: hypothetical protein IKQ31_05380 [Clostridia bacterium]|nr:hypothetical protein [Clostridia bacterium]
MKNIDQLIQLSEDIIKKVYGEAYKKEAKDYEANCKLVNSSLEAIIEADNEKTKLQKSKVIEAMAALFLTVGEDIPNRSELALAMWRSEAVAKALSGTKIYGYPCKFEPKEIWFDAITPQNAFVLDDNSQISCKYVFGPILPDRKTGELVEMKNIKYVFPLFYAYSPAGASVYKYPSGLYAARRFVYDYDIQEVTGHVSPTGEVCINSRIEGSKNGLWSKPKKSSEKVTFEDYFREIIKKDYEYTHPGEVLHATEETTSFDR